VRATLVDFDELDVLPNDVKDMLVGELVESIRKARAGLRFRRRGVSDQYLTKSVFLADLSEALRRAGIAPTRWRKFTTAVKETMNPWCSALHATSLAMPDLSFRPT